MMNPSAGRLMKEGRVQAVKLEGPRAELVERLTAIWSGR